MSRSAIIDAIRRNKPAAPAPLPGIPVFANDGADMLETFIATAETGGSQVIRISDSRDIGTALSIRFPDAGIIASPLLFIDTHINLEAVQNPAELEQVDIAVIRGGPGVAENGAIWISEADCMHRVLPFICQHLFVLLDPAGIVQNMHQAYERIRIEKQGFGVFIAGPSKTADIEQSLVTGAQAARSLTIFLTAFSDSK
ncbi:MAG: LUD domain-containing protein [Lewinellaceae bacterium]|nr:LUD domain-containing protein [Lewinellaceae bacterium]